jgi:2-desacetyl-2-hydroxyethyl bacteriochlorophyllide A dehydrogenase
MDQVICVEPGTLRFEQAQKPRRKSDEVLLRVRRVGICGTDLHIFKGQQPFLSYPRVMGHELAAEVAEAPAGSCFKTGDKVCVIPYMACGQCAACRKGRGNACMNIQVLGVHTDGGMREYLAVPERFVIDADGLTLDEAAMVEFLAVGYHAVRRAEIQPGQSVLVSGVGPIGIAAALFARLKGGEVTVIDTRQDRLDFARDHLGAANGLLVGEGIAERLAAIHKGDGFDVVFDATGAPRAMEAGFGYLAWGGIYVLISVVAADITFNDPEFHKRESTLMGSRNATHEDFAAVIDAMRSGLVPAAALNTHKVKLADLPAALEAWTAGGAGVIKAIVEC